MSNVEILDNAVLQQLRANGIEYCQSWLFDKPELGISNGARVSVRSCDIIFQMPDSETVLIVLYRKAKVDRLSLSYSFRPLVWFVGFIVENVPAVKVVRGLVDVSPYRSDDGISSRRLSEIYKRSGAEEVIIRGKRWVQLDVQRFAPIR